MSVKRIIDCRPPTEDDVRKFVNLAEKYAPDLVVDIAAYPKSVHIDLIRARVGARPGLGTEFLQHAGRLADELGVLLTLNPTELSKWKDEFTGVDYKKTTSLNRLKRFYVRNGFVSAYEIGRAHV